MYLNCHTYHSLRHGVLSPGELVRDAAKLGVGELALTDINSSSGVFDFVKACREVAIKPMVGIEFREAGQLLYTGIARDFKGFGELNRFLSRHKISSTSLPPVAPEFENAYVIYPFNPASGRKLAGTEYMGIRHFELNKLLTRVSQPEMNKLVVWQPVVFGSRAGLEVHRHLRAIDSNMLLSRLDNGSVASVYDWLVPPAKLRVAFSNYPVILQTTSDLIENCSFDFDFKQPKNKQSYTGKPASDYQMLRQLAFDGMVERYGSNNAEARERVNKELDIINKLGFATYFLITWDMIRYSMSRGFYHVGRGSGANSVVAYCLKITDVDPIELNLYFERFLNPKRTSPPDFDIDYSWREREDVQRYIFKRHGSDNVALLGAISTFQDRSTIRELAKVYGLPAEEIEQMEQPGFKPLPGTVASNIFHIASLIIDFPNLRTIHAGGILVSDLPITDFTVLELPPKGLPTTQFDMYTAEAIGFEKLDVLSQRGIGHINDCVKLVFENRGVKVDAHNVKEFKNNDKAMELLREGETNGCFYIESPAMRGLLKKLRCDNYLSLVAASSIIRPGVASSGMMREYITRFHNPGGFSYLHPVMEEQLKETFGIMVYQEDVIKVCHHFAGLDLADADVLRRAMSGKSRSREEFQRLAALFSDNCKRRGYPGNLVHEVWRQVESFAAYSFSKAHSASYAVESLQGLYLKAHYPLEFMVAVINNFGGFYSTWVYVNEARRWGATVHVPCVNKSAYLSGINGKDIYLGLVHLRDLEQQVAFKIIKERETGGYFKSLEDFLARTAIGREQVILLTRAGAFGFTRKSKPLLLWEAHLFLSGPRTGNSLPNLFNTPAKRYQLPQLTQGLIEDAYDEIELLGFPVSCSFFDLLQTSYRGEAFARELPLHVGKSLRLVGKLVTVKYVRTVKKQLMAFATFIDSRGDYFDTVHFPDALKSSPFKGYKVYLLMGLVVSEFDFVTVEVKKMAPLPFKPDPRAG